MATILMDLTHESLDYLYTLGCFDEAMYLENEVVSKQEANQINQIVYDDLFQKEYYETTFDLGSFESVDSDVELNLLNPGIYEQDCYFYEVDENGDPIEDTGENQPTTATKEDESNIMTATGTFNILIIYH